MTAMIVEQLRFVLMSACMGMLLMAGYDICRLLRWLIPHPGGLVFFEDMLFWCGMALPVYIVFYIYNNGEIRWYGVLAVVLGSMLYEWGISRCIRRLGHRWLDGPKRRFGRFLAARIRRHRENRQRKKELRRQQQEKHRIEQQEKRRAEREEEEKREKARQENREEARREKRQRKKVLRKRERKGSKKTRKR